MLYTGLTGTAVSTKFRQQNLYAESFLLQLCCPYHSHLFFQEFVEDSLQTAVALTEAVTDSTSLPDGRNLLCTFWQQLLKAITQPVLSKD